MKTPIGILMKWMEETEFMVNKEFIDKVNECLELEKQAIKESWWDGFKLQRVVVDSNADEIYFNQKYNNNEGTTLG